MVRRDVKTGLATFILSCSALFWAFYVGAFYELVALYWSETTIILALAGIEISFVKFYNKKTEIRKNIQTIYSHFGAILGLFAIMLVIMAFFISLGIFSMEEIFFLPSDSFPLLVLPANMAIPLTIIFLNNFLLIFRDLEKRKITETCVMRGIKRILIILISLIILLCTDVNLAFGTGFLVISMFFNVANESLEIAGGRGITRIVLEKIFAKKEQK